MDPLKKGGFVISAITLERCYVREMIAGEQEEAEDRVIDSWVNHKPEILVLKFFG